MARIQRGRREEMDDLYNPHGTGKKVEVINGNGNGNGNGHAAGRMYVVRSKPPLPDPYCALNVSKSTLQKPTSNSKTSFFGGNWELKRRKRVVKYEWYAIEGRVKASLKDGYGWFKHRCSRLVHGVD